MIIVKTPVRISFFGGGTDVVQWFKENGGSVLSTTIDQFCYVTYKDHTHFNGWAIKAVYSKIEKVNSVSALAHPLIRETLKYNNIENAEIVYDADLPASSGLGTSSSFAVGLQHAILASQDVEIYPKQLADSAIEIERNILNEAGGIQDQIAAAFGGLNQITFGKSLADYQVAPINIANEHIEKLFASMILCKVGGARFSYKTSFASNFDAKLHGEPLTFIHELVNKGKLLLINGQLQEFGELLGVSWMHKKSLGGVTTDLVDDMYQYGLELGAWGGKLLGAGQSGFLLFLLPPSERQEFREAMANKGVRCIIPRYYPYGSTIINR